MPEAPELHLERVLEASYESLEGVLREGPAGWLPEFGAEDGRLTSVLRWQQGGGWIDRRIDVHVGPVQRFAYGVTVRVEWKAARHPGLYPEFEGHLRLERRDARRSVLRLDGRYAPPAGQIGAAVDRVVMHRVAETSVEDFFKRVAAGLMAAASP